MFCRNCGIKLDEDAVFCMNCGVKISDKSKQNFCSYCGTELVNGAVFCIKCGAKITSPEGKETTNLSEKQTEKTETVTTKKSKLDPVQAMLLKLIIGITIGGLLLTFLASEL